MARFLSAEWIAELDQAASTNESLRAATADVTLIVQQVVSGRSGGDVSWYVVVDHGKVRVQPGRADEPDVIFTQDEETARRIGRGELSAQAAFMLGKLRVGGNVALLVTHQAAFADLDDIFGAARAAAQY